MNPRLWIGLGALGLSLYLALRDRSRRDSLRGAADPDLIAFDRAYRKLSLDRYGRIDDMSADDEMQCAVIVSELREVFELSERIARKQPAVADAARAAAMQAWLATKECRPES